MWNLHGSLGANMPSLRRSIECIFFWLPPLAGESEVYSVLFRHTTCYELMPESAKLVTLDSMLPVGPLKLFISGVARCFTCFTDYQWCQFKEAKIASSRCLSNYISNFNSQRPQLALRLSPPSPYSWKLRAHNKHWDIQVDANPIHSLA